MPGKTSQLLLVSFMTALVLAVTGAGGYGMAEKIKGPAAEVAVTVEPFPGRGKTATLERIEAVGRELIERLFPHDYARSAQIKGKVARVKEEGEKSVFELNALFLYRETYTAVTHRVIFSVTGDEYSVVSVDGGK